MAMTIADLIAKKELIKTSREANVTLNVKDFGDFVFRLPTASDIVDSEAYEESRKEDGIAKEAYLVASCSVEPPLGSKQLTDEFGCANGIEVTKHVFKDGHIRMLYLRLLQAAGYDESHVTLVEEVKN